MKEDYPAYHKKLRKLAAELSRDLRGPMSAFAQLNGATTAPGALDAKTKQLLALGIAISTQCRGCIAYHVHDAIRAGASRDEIIETMGVSILMGGGPAVIQACEAMEAMDQFTSAEKPVHSP